MSAVDAPDPEDVIECPFDKTHMIRHKKLQYHLNKCRKQHLDVPMGRCPFNAKHVYAKVELPFHITTCPDKDLILPTVVHNQESRASVKPDPVFEYETIENWESESVATYFNLCSGGNINSYTRPKDSFRQPRDVPEVLRQGLPPGAPPVLPFTAKAGHGKSAAMTTSGNTCSNNAGQAQQTPGAGHGIARPGVEFQSSIGYGRGQNKVVAGQAAVGSKSAPTLGSLVGGVQGATNPSAGPSIQQRPARAATTTAAFGLSSLCLNPQPTSGLGRGLTATNRTTEPLLSTNSNQQLRHASNHSSPCRFSSPALSDDGENQECEIDPTKLKRRLEKKVKQIEQLERDQMDGKFLDDAQLLKIAAKGKVLEQLREFQ